MPDPIQDEFRPFQTTHWSLVGRAGQGDAAQKQALAQLVTRYLPALRTHLVLRKKFDRETADDYLQSFIAAKVLEADLVAEARRDKGKFRTFLLTALDRFVVSQLRYERARKRSAEGTMAINEEMDPADTSQPGPDTGFDVAWARELLDEVIKRMREECEATGRRDVWGVFETRLLGPMLYDTPPISYEELVARFGLKTPAQASNVLVTSKRTFARVLRAVIGEYEPDEERIDSEIADLQAALALARSD